MEGDIWCVERWKGAALGVMRRRKPRKEDLKGRPEGKT
jgi:hypothetical protein